MRNSSLRARRLLSGYPGPRITTVNQSSISTHSKSNCNAITQRNDRRVVAIIGKQQFVEFPDPFRILILYSPIGHAPRPQDVIGDEESTDSDPPGSLPIHFRIVMLIDIM